MARTKKTRRAGNFGEEQRDGRKLDSVAPFEAAICDDDTTRTLALVREGREWVKACPEAWNAARRHALDRARAGRRVTWHDVASVVTSRDYLDHRDGRDVRLDNSLGPLLMRWIVVLHPETAPFVERRRSRFDEVEVGGPFDL